MQVVLYAQDIQELDRFMIREERYRTEFKCHLDRDGAIMIGTFRATPSEVLESMNVGSFRRQYKKWFMGQLDHIFSLAMEKYPHPVAYFAYMVLHAYDNHTHRLQLLRSLWEAVIHFLFTLVLEEFRQTGIAFKTVTMEEGNVLKGAHCRTDSLGKKIDITRSILRAARGHLKASAHVVRDEYVFDKLVELNRVRNDMQHGYALGEEESQALFERLEKVVREVLYDLKGLSDVRCLKFRRMEGMDRAVYAEFRGWSGLGRDIYL